MGSRSRLERSAHLPARWALEEIHHWVVSAPQVRTVSSKPPSNGTVIVRNPFPESFTKSK